MTKTITPASSRRTHEDLAHIRDRVAVYGCPTHDAAHYLAAFVAAHDLGDGIVRIPMRACAMCSDQRVPTKLSIAASMYSLHSTSDRQLTYSAMWFPETSDPSLMFAGALAVEVMPHDDRFSLLLSGHHVPRGTVDGGPKTSHGRSRTHVAPHDVLRTIATHIEKAHAHDQAAHAGHPFAYASQELGTAAGESLNERSLPEGFHSGGRSGDRSAHDIDKCWSTNGVPMERLLPKERPAFREGKHSWRKSGTGLAHRATSSITAALWRH